MLDAQEATEFVIHELSRFGNRHDLTRTVCEKYNMRWDDANTFIARVAAENKDSIESRKGSTLNVLAIGFIVVGVLLVLSSVISPFLGLMFISLRTPFIPYWGNVVMFIMGLGMTIGGLRHTLKLNSN